MTFALSFRTWSIRTLVRPLNQAFPKLWELRLKSLLFRKSLLLRKKPRLLHCLPGKFRHPASRGHLRQILRMKFRSLLTQTRPDRSRFHPLQTLRRLTLCPQIYRT